jgi:hypothetical protein
MSLALHLRRYFMAALPALLSVTAVLFLEACGSHDATAASGIGLPVGASHATISFPANHMGDNRSFRGLASDKRLDGDFYEPNITCITGSYSLVGTVSGTFDGMTFHGRVSCGAGQPPVQTITGEIAGQSVHGTLISLGRFAGKWRIFGKLGQRNVVANFTVEDRSPFVHNGMEVIPVTIHVAG